MYDLHALSPKVLDWVCNEALNELNAYLCEVDFRRMYGNEWPEMAREAAASCRGVAKAATDVVSKEAWLSIAKEYEDTIEDTALLRSSETAAPNR